MTARTAALGGLSLSDGPAHSTVSDKGIGEQHANQHDAFQAAEIPPGFWTSLGCAWAVRSLLSPERFMRYIHQPRRIHQRRRILRSLALAIWQQCGPVGT